MLLSYFQHVQACRAKQAAREEQISSLSKSYFSAFSSNDTSILKLNIPDLVSQTQSGTLSRAQILLTYGKKAIEAQKATNCLSEIMISNVEMGSGKRNEGLLAGVPVSLKDSICVKGFDATISFSAWAGKPSTHDSAIVQLLRDAGAILHVKTTVPTTLLAAEVDSDLFGRTSNPYNPNYSSGGSSGGAGALLAYGGAKIDIGTDLAGSVRVPSHYCGLYTVKSSAGRFPVSGGVSSVNGLEGVQLVSSPIARSLLDLEEFWKRVTEMKPWEYDHSCVPIPWRQNTLSASKVRWGIMWDDGVVTPAPACRRALEIVVNALRAEGHEVFDFNAPDPYEALSVGSQLIFADGGNQLTSQVRWGEKLDPGVRQAQYTISWPKIFKQIYALVVRYIYRDPIWADIIVNFHKKTVGEQWDLVVRRETYRAQWHEAWKNAGLDLLLTVPSATPAIPTGGMENATIAHCGYALLFNVLDYAAGVLPVTYVDAVLDALPTNFRQTTYRSMNAVAKGSYDNYDAEKMHGLPVGIQVVGRRLEEEKTLEGMKLIEAALQKRGMAFRHREF